MDDEILLTWSKLDGTRRERQETEAEGQDEKAKKTGDKESENKHDSSGNEDNGCASQSSDICDMELDKKEPRQA